MTMRAVGFNLSHDSSVCLVEDGVIRSALAVERTTRIKRGTVPLHIFPAVMADLTHEILADAGLSIDDVNCWIATSTESRNAEDEAQLPSLLGMLVPPERCVQLPHPGHHLAHAAAAFYTSGFAEAAAISVDAYGSLVETAREQESGFYFRTGAEPTTVLRTLRDSERAAGYPREGRLWLPERLSGIGEIYRVITLALGLYESGTVYDDAGKTMGLASFGKRLSHENLFIEPATDGGLDFNRAAESLLELGLATRQGNELRLEMRAHGASFEQFHYDLAAQVQEEFEDACLHLTREVLKRTGSRSLVASGGCFLNSKLNTRLLRETDIDQLFVFPAATDDGNAAGAALYAYHHLAGLPAASTPTPAIRHVYFGPSRVAGRDLPELVNRWQLSAESHEDPSSFTAAAAAAIGAGKIVAWFQDRAEFGPRALGARSILCHPGIPGIKDRLNARVKFREKFRPFAAAVLAEQAEKWFDMPTAESPFMLLVCDVLPAARTRISEVTHVDGTCRVQTVAKDNPGPFRELIKAFEQESGLPLVLNTSFNLRGMPIVEQPEQAIDCLYGSRLDRLYIGNLEVMPPDLTSLRPVLSKQAEGRRAGLQSAAVNKAGAALPQAGHHLLACADGEQSMREICAELGLDLNKGIDTALDLRRLGLLRWAGVPQIQGRTYPLVQYLPVADMG